MSNGQDTFVWSWEDDAACKGKGELFYAPFQEQRHHRLLRILAAQAICATCPVSVECDAAAKQRDERFGIWAGEPRGAEPKLPATEKRRRTKEAS